MSIDLIITKEGGLNLEQCAGTPRSQLLDWINLLPLLASSDKDLCEEENRSSVELDERSRSCCQNRSDKEADLVLPAHVYCTSVLPWPQVAILEEHYRVVRTGESETPLVGVGVENTPWDVLILHDIRFSLMKTKEKVEKPTHRHDHSLRVKAAASTIST